METEFSSNDFDTDKVPSVGLTLKFFSTVKFFLANLHIQFYQGIFGPFSYTVQRWKENDSPLTEPIQAN